MLKSKKYWCTNNKYDVTRSLKRHNFLTIILLILLVFSSFLNISHASSTGIVYLSSDKDSLEKGEDIEIVVHIENTKTAAFSFSLYFDESKLEYISDLENTNILENRVIFVWYDVNGGNGAKEGELVKFKFRAKEEGLATFSLQGEFYNQVGQFIQTNFREKQVQIGKEKSNLQKQGDEEQGSNSQNSNANLQVLRLDKEGMIPSFEKEIHEYYLTIPENIQNIEVLAISENPSATIEISGNTNLKEGLNLITIQVISEDKTQSNIYTIQVTKTANIDLANSNLEILAIENVLLNPPFDTNVTNYKTEISNKMQGINMLAIPENEQATVEISGKDNLVEGSNLINVIVTAPNGFTTKKYVVEVYKRNSEEENEYEKEQDSQNENLEQAYKIEELSNDGNPGQVTIAENQQATNKVIWIIMIVIIILVLALVFLYIKRKKKKS